MTGDVNDVVSVFHLRFYSSLLYNVIIGTGDDTMVKTFFIKLRGKLYFLPGVYALIFTVVAGLLAYADLNPEIFGYANMPAVLLSTRDFGVAMFTAMIGGLLTMLTITFSTMMVVLTIYGGELSPRTLQDFLERKTTQRVLGVFVGVLVYAIISLYFIKQADETGLIASPLFGILFLLLSVFYFAYFIHYVAKSVQVNQYLQQLTKETMALIDEKEQTIKDNPLIQKELDDELEKIYEGTSYKVKTNVIGYLQLYRTEKMFNIAKDHDFVIRTMKMIGEYVLENETLLEIYGYDKDDLDQELVDEIREAIVIGDEINLYDDIGSSSRKMVEIALRALSPGINDPQTAVFCIEQIGTILKRVARNYDALTYAEENRQVRLIVQNKKFSRILYDHFVQIKIYGGDDPFVMNACLNAFVQIAKTNEPFIRDEVWDFVVYLFADLIHSLDREKDLFFIGNTIFRLAGITEHMDDFRKAFPKLDSIHYGFTDEDDAKESS
jgi:uncharacterized membrane protein